ncbi:MFS transporter [Demequina sp. TTPB684]|uniref:MFS transporter n=1 Tax=unclassified Demequina TaxID=2620311 RepID=UPI001CF2BA3E|nr:MULTISPECIES: MFS transporter [unclassified Demequina]MCB2412999.1 MFS transporter [Demequina sp. TTPB684]UPU87068.1 MFS transporter [Demequina sp. TMPB413]
MLGSTRLSTTSGSIAYDDPDPTRELPHVPEALVLETTPIEDVEPLEDVTTASMPIVASASAVVVDEADAGTRSVEALALSPLRAKLALATLSASAFAMGANEVSVVALSQTIATGLGVPLASIGLVATAFALTVVVAATPLTLITARVSRRLTLSITLGVWTAGVVIAASSQSIVQLAGGRIVTAAAHALFWAVVAPTATSLFAPHLRARTITRVMVGSAAAGVVGTPLVTLTGTTFSWQAPYWGLAVIGAMLTASVILSLPGGVRRHEGHTPHTRGDLPSRRMFARVLAVAFTATVGMSVSWTYIVPFFTRQVGLSVGSIPALFALGGIVAVATTLSITPLLARNVVHAVRFGLALLAMAWGLLSLATTWSALAAQVLQAAGWAALVAALLNWAMRHTPWRTDVGASMYTVAVNFGAAAGPVMGAAIVAEWGTGALPLASFVLTMAAGAITTTIDSDTLRRLRVPRRLRVAVQARFDLRQRRAAWAARTRPTALRPRGRAVAFTGGAEKARTALRNRKRRVRR